MNLSSLLGMLLKLIPSAILGVESLVGDTKSGATKKQMAQDALTAAVSGASTVLTGTNLQLAQVVGAATSAIIDDTVTSTQATGQYQAATAVGNALQASGSGSSSTTAKPSLVAASSGTIEPQAPSSTELEPEGPQS